LKILNLVVSWHVAISVSLTKHQQKKKKKKKKKKKNDEKKKKKKKVGTYHTNTGAVSIAEYLGTKVAVKRLFDLDDDMKIYLQRELNVLKQIRHPNIVQFLGLSKTVEGLYLITEFVERGDLCRLLYDRNVTELESWALRLRIDIAAAQGLAYLHAKNLIHRDIKAANFLVAENWNVKLCDFGFSRSVASAKGLAGLQAGNVMTLCVPADHELLTNKGFMDLDAFLARQCAGESDLLVAGYSPDSQQLVFEAPLALKTFDVTEHPLIEFGGDDDAHGVHLLATRDHDMFVQLARDERAPVAKRDASGNALLAPAMPYAKVKAGALHDAGRAVRHLAAAAAGVAAPSAAADAAEQVFAALRLDSATQRLCFLEQYGFWLLARSTAGVPGDWADWFVAHGGDECMAPFVWSLDATSLRALVAGLRRADATLRTPSACMRDELVRVLLLAGYSPHFRRAEKAWQIECASPDSAEARPPTSGTRQVTFAGRVWCFKMPSGFVWARRAVKDAASGVVCEASRALVLGNCGTDEWMAPETMMGLEYSNTADVFSFSVFLTETMFRAEPEQRSPGVGFRFDVPKFKTALTRLSDCPPELAQIVLDGTTYDPAARPSMKKILQRLQTLAKTVQDVAPTTASSPRGAVAPVAVAAPVAETAAAAEAAPAVVAATTSADNGDSDEARRLTKSKKKKEKGDKHGDKHKDSKDKAKKKEKKDKEKDGKEKDGKEKDAKESERRHRH
jgi:serine/threonine protein kinase